MAPPVNGSTHLIPAYYSFYRPRKDERLSWPSWLSYSGWLTNISGHPSAAGRAQDRESSPARDRRSTTVPRHQLDTERNYIIVTLCGPICGEMILPPISGSCRRCVFDARLSIGLNAFTFSTREHCDSNAPCSSKLHFL